LDNVRIPVLDAVLPDGIPRGRAIAVFFDTASHWYSLVSSIAAQRLREQSKVVVVTTTRFPDQIRADLVESGIDNVARYEEDVALLIADWYSWVTGRPGVDKYNLPGAAAASLKVEELALITNKLWMTKDGIKPECNPLFIELVVFDNCSNIFLYNPAEACLRLLNGTTGRLKQDGRVVLAGFASKMHNEAIIQSVESMVDGILDVATRDVEGAIKSYIRVRRFFGAKHRQGWYELLSTSSGIRLSQEMST